MRNSQQPSDEFFAVRTDASIAVLNAELLARHGDFVILHNPGAQAPNSLIAEVTNAFAVSKDLLAIYFDETYPTVFLPKPSFDEDMLLAVDYVGSHVAIRLKALVAVGSLPENYPATELRSLVLAAALRFGRKSVGHLPVIVSPPNVKLPDNQSAGMRETRRLCSADYLANKNISADCVLDARTGIVHVHRKLAATYPPVSIIVPTRDRLDLLRPCIDSVLQKTDYPDFEIVVIDNGSVETKTLDYLKALGAHNRISIRRIGGPFNFSALNNAAAKTATGEVLVFLNNDTEVLNAEWLQQLVVNAIRPEIGAVGAKLFYPDGRIQHGGINLGGPMMASHAYRFFPGDHAGYMHRLRVPHRMDAVTAACMAVAAEKFHAVGGFDETDFPVAYNDVDLCLKLEQAGHINLWTPYATLIHKEQATRGEERNSREAKAFAHKWRDRLAAAPVNPLDA